MSIGVVAVPLAGRGRATARRVLAAAVAGALLLGVAAHQAVRAQQGDDAVDVDALVAALVEVEEELAGIPLLPDVSVTPEDTWATISGDFVGASVLLEDLDERLQALVAEASEADEPVVDAVEQVAASYRTMHEGYSYLAAYEQAGLVIVPTVPLEGEEDTELPELATGVDEPRGQAEVGLVLLLQALAGFQEGYAVLQNADEAADVRSLFQVRYNEVQQAALTEALDARLALSLPATERLIAVTRFQPRFAGESPAQVVRYVCVDWDDYTTVRADLMRPEGPYVDLEVPLGDEADLPIPDCPNLPGNDTRVVPAPSS